MKNKDGFSKNVMKLIKQEVDYKYKGKTKKVVVEDVRHSMACIINLKTKVKTPAVEFKMRPVNGDRAFWSKPFKNI